MEDTLGAFLAVLQLLFKFVALPLVLTGLAWFSSEWLLFPLKSEGGKRNGAMFISMAVVALAHAGDLDAMVGADFGAGPQGWILSILMGFIAGGLAPLFHDQVVSRFLPFLKRPTGGAL